MSGQLAKIENVYVKREGKEIVKGISLEVNRKEVHAIMGPNGSGKSTLAYGLAGHPYYEATGSFLLEGEEMLTKKPEERALKGLFLAFQQPISIEGLSILKLLKKAYYTKHKLKESLENYKKFRKEVEKAIEFLGLKEEFLKREVNVNLSGGEKKKIELLQMLILKPKLAIIDEIDSGLDVDSLKLVGKVLNKIKEENGGLIIITHYTRIFSSIQPDRIHVMKKGRIVKTGDYSLAEIIDREGYKVF